MNFPERQKKTGGHHTLFKDKALLKTVVLWSRIVILACLFSISKKKKVKERTVDKVGVLILTQIAPWYKFLQVM